MLRPGLAGIPFRLRTGDGTLVAATVSGADGTLDSDFAVEVPGSAMFEHHTPAFAFPTDGVIDHIDAGYGDFTD